LIFTQRCAKRGALGIFPEDPRRHCQDTKNHHSEKLESRIHRHRLLFLFAALGREQGRSRPKAASCLLLCGEAHGAGGRCSLTRQRVGLRQEWKRRQKRTVIAAGGQVAQLAVRFDELCSLQDDKDAAVRASRKSGAVKSLPGAKCATARETAAIRKLDVGKLSR